MIGQEEESNEGMKVKQVNILLFLIPLFLLLILFLIFIPSYLLYSRFRFLFFLPHLILLRYQSLTLLFLPPSLLPFFLLSLSLVFLSLFFLPHKFSPFSPLVHPFSSSSSSSLQSCTSLSQFSSLSVCFTSPLPSLALATIRKVEENLAEENTKVLMISHKQMGEGQVKGVLGGEGRGALGCLDEEGRES